MESIRSADGTTIAYARSGTGPSLVLVHGTTADHSRWTNILPALERRFTVLAMDRRGRGASGDAPDYDLAREFEDVAAVVGAAGPGPALLGHSFGALCSMEAALLVSGLSRLILYEPPFSPPGVSMYPPGTAERYSAMLDAGKREDLLIAFFTEVVRAPPDQMAALRKDPSWTARIAAAHTLVRELRDDTYIFDPARFAALDTPTLVLRGELSPPFLREAAARVAESLPAARLVELPGQGHVAMTTAPELFLSEVTGFLGA